MCASVLRLTARFRWKLLPALLVVALGDWLFYQNQFYGGYLGLFTLAVLGALLVGRRAVRRDRGAWLALAAAALFSGALLYDASMLAWVLFWIAATMAALLPATARFDDGWRWFQRCCCTDCVRPSCRSSILNACSRSARRDDRAAVAFGRPLAHSPSP